MYFDLCLPWYWEHDADFIHMVEVACAQQGVTVYQVTPLNLLETITRLYTGQLSFHALLDRANDYNKFEPIRRWAKASGAYYINLPELAFKIEQKDSTHFDFITQGINTPYTLILPSFIEEPVLPEYDLTPLGIPFVVKPSYAGGGTGVLCDLTEWEQVLHARMEVPDQRYLVQAFVHTQWLDGKQSWFRVYYVDGCTLPCWWDPVTHHFTAVIAADEAQFDLTPLHAITRQIAALAKLDWFSTEIALTPEGQWVVVDYVNDSIDLRVQSKAADGAPDQIVKQIAEGLVTLVKRKRHLPEKIIASYGSWKSPITTDLMAAKTIGLGQLALDNGDVYLSESRPLEGGRNALVRFRPGSEPADCLPSDFNVRTRVHEYGGGAFAVFEGVIYFVNFKDQHLYHCVEGGMPEGLTPGDGYRYADFAFDKTRQRLICVREDHTQAGEAVNTIVAVSLNGNDNGTVLVEGYNFFSNPRLSPDETQLCWLAWNHPNMPWDGTELWVASIQADGALGERKQVAGGMSESIFQPEWSPAGVLHFVSDRSGWWNLYHLNGDVAEALYPMEAEFGLPQWVFGMGTYDFISADELLCTFTQNGIWSLARLNTQTRTLTRLDLPYEDFIGVQVENGAAFFIAASSTQPYALLHCDLSTEAPTVLRRSFEPTVDEGYFSMPRAVEFPTTNGLSAHGVFYPPVNKDFVAPEGELPPLVVMSHGGPTSQTGTALRYVIQYWTSRGFAVLDVNYGGSTGYGRAYRMRLNDNWGIVDVDDCANGALWLAEQKCVDRRHMAIRGGSAGGFTTLACLVFKKGVFGAGASHFGVSDLEALARDTHKFESRYCDNLIGPYPARKDIYEARSPIHHVHKLSTPLILLQGDSDPVVPPNQAEIMFAAARAREIPTAFLLFKDEQHGFRKAENIKRALEAELYFYSKIFKFDLVDDIEPVEIENL